MKINMPDLILSSQYIGPIVQKSSHYQKSKAYCIKLTECGYSVYSLLINQQVILQPSNELFLNLISSLNVKLLCSFWIPHTVGFTSQYHNINYKEPIVAISKEEDVIYDIFNDLKAKIFNHIEARVFAELQNKVVARDVMNHEIKQLLTFSLRGCES